MILVQFLENSNYFENISDSVNYIENCGVHPDLLWIFDNNKKISYLSLLEKNNSTPIHECDIYSDIYPIIYDIKKDIIATKYKKILFTQNIYPYGCSAKDKILKVGFHPIVALFISYDKNYLNDFHVSSQQVRRIVKRNLKNDWVLARLEEDKGTKLDFNCKWLQYNIFLTKKREKF